MKLTHQRFVIIGLTILVAACDSKQAAAPAGGNPSATAAAPPQAPVLPESAEKTALTGFKNDVKALQQWLDDKQCVGKTAAGPVDANAMMGEFVAKAKALNTDGMPADLKDAWGEFIGVMGEVEAVFKTLPKPDPANPQALPKAMNDIQPQLTTLRDKIKPLVDKLAETGKKHGIEDLQKLGPGGQVPPNPARSS